jgi:uncharacterized membrane protein
LVSRLPPEVSTYYQAQRLYRSDNQFSITLMMRWVLGALKIWYIGIVFNNYSFANAFVCFFLYCYYFYYYCYSFCHVIFLQSGISSTFSSALFTFISAVIKAMLLQIIIIILWKKRGKKRENEN